ncbi:hypothetical protein [Acidithiobacillus thiooxidans]|uniref:hypothetical protein n=1 Tax=Acidithiobacillus thiooxidans TaxID=930 RepID=UPI0004E277D5|nr:hypothetical protein [Acidithiobacillus thiooxidans]
MEFKRWRRAWAGACFTILGLAVPVTASAVNLGIQGKVWPIAEVNILKLLVESATQVNWHHVQQGLLKKAENWGSQLPQWNFPEVSQTKTVWFNPSISLVKPVYGPKKSRNGNYEWALLYPAGTTVNPLQYERPPTDMLFFNGTVPAQVDLAKQALKAFGASIYIVETAGNPENLAKSLDVPVYYANKGILARFPIRKLPTLMGVGTGPHEYDLALTELAPPFSVKQLQAYWNGMIAVPGANHVQKP